MSIRTINTRMRPTDLEDYLTAFHVEAPPFLTGIRIKKTFSGGRLKVVGAITKEETLSYSVEKTFTRIPMLRDSATNGISTPLDIRDPDVQGFGSGADLYPENVDECRIVMPTWGTSDVWKSPQIAKAPLEIYYQTELDEVCGSWTYTDADDPTNDDSGDIHTGPNGWPSFFFAFPAGDEYRTPMTKWITFTGATFVAPTHSLGTATRNGVSDLDVTGWDHQKWRSKLGINTVSYGETHVDPDITSTVLVEIEWELLA